MTNATTPEKLQKLRKQLNSCFIERSQIIDGLLAVLLLGGNAVLFGPPGCAKSAMLLQICNAIEGAKFFNRLLQKAQPPEELLGQPSLKALQEEDMLRRNTTNRLPEAHIAFLDEIFRCNPTTLNALLRIINEKIFENPEPQKIPLLFLVGAANHVPKDDEMAAFVDRFIFRPWVGYVTRAKSREKLIHRAIHGNPEVTVKLSLDEVYQMQKDTKNIAVSPEIITALLQIHGILKEQAFLISDRKLQQLVNLLQCYAYTQGDNEVFVDHIHELFPHCLWRTEPKEINEIRKLLKETYPSPLQKVNEFYDAAKIEANEVTKLATQYDNNPHSNNEINLLDAITKTTTTLANLRDKIKAAIGNSKSKDAEKAQKKLEAIEEIMEETAGYRDRVI